MSNFTKLSVLLKNTTTKTFRPQVKSQIDNSKIRKSEWTKYCTDYYSLICSSTKSNYNFSFLSDSFCYINGDNFYPQNFENTNVKKLDLDKYIHESVVIKPKLIWLPCMDERLQYLTSSRYALSLGLPGCECLLSHKEKELVANEVVDICKKHPSIKEIVASSHSSCGAVAKAVSITKKSETMLNRLFDILNNNQHYLDKQSERYAWNFAQILKEKTTKENLEILVRTHHFAKEDLHSVDLHNAFGAIISFDPLLNSADFEDTINLPMFNIYAGGQSAEKIAENTVLANLISSGEYGLGSDYFSHDKPFVLIFAINLNNSTEERIQTLQKVIEILSTRELKLDTIFKVLNTGK